MPITVCHPVWRLERGGLERQLMQLVARQDPGIRHVLIVRGSFESDFQHGLPPQVQVIWEPGIGPDPNWSRRLAWILRQERVDILHVRGLSMLLDCVMAAELCESLPVIFSFHGFESQRRQWSSLRRRLLRAAILRCETRAAVSRSAAESLAAELMLPEQEFEILSNGVDTDVFRPSPDRQVTRRKLNLPSDRLIVLCVANLKPIKGHTVLLRAIESLSGESGAMTFVMVGRDYSNREIESEGKARCPRADIRFVGASEKTSSWYQAADLYVQPSLWEGNCNALLEAMSCELPVIATDAGGNRDAIDHDRTGLLVPPGDSESLAAAIQSLARDEPRRNCLARAARQHIRSECRLEVTLQSWIDRYQMMERREGQADGGRSCAAKKLAPA
jgi:glycosyltransferase involved in cell wall biosynthesis